MDDQPDRLLDTNEQILILAQVERELDAEVREQNKMSKARDAIRSMRGAVGRVTDGILQAKDEIDAAEREAMELTESAKGAQFKELGAIKGELREIINDLKDVSNGPPAGPLSGSESPSMSSGGSTENPT